MKKSIVFFILTIGWLIEGCYEDKGHYDYIRISGPEVTGIEKFYTVYDGGNFDIHPSVTWTYGELENYTYSWKVDGISVSDKAELTEQVKDLPVKANMYAEFVITDEDTGVEYITQFRVTVSSVYERGWMLLADQGRLLCCRWSGMTRSFTKTLIVWPMMQIWQAVQSDYTNIGRLGRKMWDRCLWLARKDRNIP